MDFPAVREKTVASRNHNGKIPAVEIFSEKPEINFYRDLWQAIESYGASNRERLANGKGRVTQTALAGDLGVKAPDLSAIKLLALGEAIERKPARASVEMLAGKFGVAMPK